jgi:methionyl aminopeptidase
MIIVKSAREIELIRKASKVIAKVFEEIKPFIKPGVSTLEIATEAERIILENDCTPTFKGYGGFPGAICVSVNDTLIHGIPSKKIVLKEGDIVSLDVGATYKGYCGDAGRTYLVGTCTSETKKLVTTTEESFFEAMKYAKPGNKIGDISAAIQKYNEDRGYSLPREFTGHGTGRHLHEDPNIPNYGIPGTGATLREGMTIAIEPMVAEGKYYTRTLSDGWTVKMKDGKLSAHYENTIVVTKDGYEILTM